MLSGTRHTGLFPSGTIARYLAGQGKLLLLTASTTHILQHSHTIFVIVFAHVACFYILMSNTDEVILKSFEIREISSQTTVSTFISCVTLTSSILRFL